MRGRLVLPLCLAALAALSCRPDGPEAPPSLTLYSGRSEALVAPLIDRFEQESGIEVQVRWGDTGELAAAILEEGERSPAQVFLAQDGSTLATLAATGRLVALPKEILERVEPRWADPAGRWVGLSGRVRTMVIDPERVPEDERPTSLSDLTDPRWAGRLALAPSNASLQAHLAAWRAHHGEAGLARLLEGIAANRPLLLPKNTAVVEAVLSGEADLGLINHYYLLQAQRQRGEAVGLNWVPTASDRSAFVNLAGAGLLADSDAGRRLLTFLLAPEAQRWFAEQTFEIPLAIDAPPTDIGLDLRGLAGAPGDLDRVDFGKVADELAGTLRQLRESGLLQ